MARLDSFLRVVVEQSASDLHLSSGAVPVIRRDGDLERLPFRAMSEVETRRFLFEVFSPDQIDALERDHSVDFVYAVEDCGRFRGNAFFHANGIGAVFRIIPDAPLSIEELELPQVCQSVAELERGLVLVCGPTGAGKTTTVAAMLHAVNAARAGHIITVEDPIEFVHRSLECVVSQRQVGEHARSYAESVRAAAREAPDVLSIGEVRDEETVRGALDAAEQGALVFATLHASSAPQAVHRLVDLFPEAQKRDASARLARQVQAIFAQRLVKRATGEGRVAAIEILLANAATRQLIKEEKAHQIAGYLQGPEAETMGMQTFASALAHLVLTGVVTLEEANLHGDEEGNVNDALADIRARLERAPGVA